MRQSKTLDPCAGYSWPPKCSGILNLTGAKCLSSSQSPGPIYLLPSTIGCEKADPRSVFRKAPCITIKGRNYTTQTDCSPGPIYNPLPAKDSGTGSGPDSGPGSSIKSRNPEKVNQDSPGPAYNVLPPKMCNPGFSLGKRLTETTESTGPGPAGYNLPSMIGCHYIPNRPNAPCYSLSGRHKQIEKEGGPGPGTYTIVCDCATQECSPKPSLSSRSYPPDEGSGAAIPGPGAYCPERVRNFPEAPHYSFGIKWCDKVNAELRHTKADEDYDVKCPVTC